MSRGYLRHLITFWEEKEMRKHQRADVRELANIWSLPSEEFLEIYKISPEMVHYLCEELEEDLAPRTIEGLPVHIKVLASLKVLINGHYQRGNGQDQNTSIAQTTVSKYLKQFVAAVNNKLKPKWILFPGTEEDRRTVARGFQTKFGLPNIVGAIDCTHVTLFPPPGVEKVQYLNHNRDMSINVQLICDSDCRILNVNADFPGRVHDQFIFNASNIKAELRRLYNNRIGDYYLLGDSGYALEPWLMTPVRGAESHSPEARYTDWHCRARNTIERTNGYLKGTFRMLGLDRNFHYAPEKTSDLIYAACTLYNIMKYFRMSMNEIAPQEELESPEIDQLVPPPTQGLLQIAAQKRNQIINNHFT